MIENIYFFASFGDLKGKPTGGGTTAARRLRSTLVHNGFNVEITNRHRLPIKGSLWKKIMKYVWLIIDPILFFFKLLFKKRKDSSVLFMAYAGALLPFEFLISLVTTLAGHKKIMYLAGGKAKWTYDEGSRMYRWLFRKTVAQYALIMTEGEITMKLIDDVTGGKVKTFYLPNYTEEGFAPSVLPEKSKDTVNIMYFGRIAPEKNTLLILDVFDELCKKYSNLHLQLVGSGTNSYEEEVSTRIDFSPNSAKINWKSWADHATLKQLMKDQHIYIFPSAEPCEGHSNALNEAMSWGLIPVVSKNNFLPAIVGLPELVACDYKSDSYAKIISQIIDSSKLDYYSERMYLRVKENFTQSKVEQKLYHTIKNI